MSSATIEEKVLLSTSNSVVILEMDEEAQIDAVFGHGGFIWSLQPDVAPVLLDPSLDRKAGLLYVDFTAFAENATYARSPESSFTGQRKLGIFFRGGLQT